MLKYISRIFKTNFSRFIFDGRILSSDYEIIEDNLQFMTIQYNSPRQFSKHLEDKIENICKQIHFKIRLHTAYKNKDLSLLEGFRDFKYTHLLKMRFEPIFSEDVVYNKLSTLNDNPGYKENIGFISFKVNEKYFYILELDESKLHRYYLRFIFTTLRAVFISYNDFREKRELTNQVEKIKQMLVEKEESLQIAEKAVKRKVYDLHNLVEASNDIYSILNFRQLVNSALLTVIGQIGVQSAFVLMYDQSKRSYSQIYQKGFKAKEIEKLRFKVDSPLVKYFTKHNAPVYTENLTKLKDFETYIKKLKDLGIFIIAPLIYSERMQGIIATGGKLYSTEFSQTDFELFHILVNIISISIENSLHYEAVKNLSLTDEMTNLHNYRSFISRLKEEINRGRRGKSKVSLLILDIDHFKNYNDTLGHQAGDEALREVGKVLRKTVRDEDIVSRYGGEEFCVIFPGIEKEGIQNLGERIRVKIEKHKFYKEKVQPNGRLTVSLGGSTYPDDATDMNGLIQKADEALYHAKHLGRNQIKIYE